MIRLFRVLLLCLAVAVAAAPATAGPAVENQPHGQQTAGSDHNGTIGTALALVEQGKSDEAEQLLLQALALNPDPAQVYYQLGRIYEQRGDNLKAIAAFKEGIRIHEQGRRTSR
jgi:tetratricopeptide (TPR) repeat protein